MMKNCVTVLLLFILILPAPVMAKDYPVTMDKNYSDEDINIMKSSVAALEKFAKETKLKLKKDNFYCKYETEIMEYTSKKYPVNFEKFTEILSPDKWGTNLKYYLGGDIKVLKKDKNGRVIRQIERMVLRPPTTALFTCIGEEDQDMTKIEDITYSKNEIKVSWRVDFSDNNTVIKDVGSLTFVRDNNETVLIFCSAHKLNTKMTTTNLISEKASEKIIGKTLVFTFKKHLENYAEMMKAKLLEK